MIVLDTNVLSEFVRREPDAVVIAWLDRQSAPQLTTTAITVFELLSGVALLPHGNRRSQLGRAVAAQIAAFDGRLLSFDAAAAAHAADIAAARREQGRPIAVQDAQIAGIVRARGFTLATRNTRDFDETQVALLDPWQV